MPTFRQTPFRAGRLTVAGERGRRAFWLERPLVRTWFRVAGLGVVEEKGRVVVDWKVERSVGGMIVVLVRRLGVVERVRRRSAWRRVDEGVGGMVAVDSNSVRRDGCFHRECEILNILVISGDLW